MLASLGDNLNMSTSNCRFYENPFPAIDEFVMVNVQQVSAD